MSEARAQLGNLVGEWSGTKKLWMMPDTPAVECKSTAVITPEAGGRVIAVRYTWESDGQPCEGIVLVRMATSPSDADLVWMDSWHQPDVFMLCPAEDDAQLLIAGRGSYAAPPGPDWGWRIALQSQGPDDFRIVMHNITPEGREELAVEAVYKRAKENDNS